MYKFLLKLLKLLNLLCSLGRYEERYVYISFLCLDIHSVNEKLLKLLQKTALKDSAAMSSAK